MEDISRRIAVFNQPRLPEMVRLKYEAMVENPFRFYRGTNHIFYEDLAKSAAIPGSPASWISGDLHLENFGSFKSDNRLVYFDLNDFDESILAPVIWELYRLVTSIFVAFESLDIDQKKALNMARQFVKSYARTLQIGKPNYIEPQTAKGIVCDFLMSVSQRKQKEILAKRTILKKNKLAILSDDPRHIELDDDHKKDLFVHITDWLKNNGESPYNYKVTDAVFRLAGTGSVGVKRYALLLKSLNKVGEKYLLIDMKQAVTSSLAPYEFIQQPAWEQEAQRVVAIQQLMQNRGPALLSTTVFRGESYVIQEMQPTKDSIDFKLISKQYRDMYQVIDDMGMLTASSQLRSTGRMGSCTAESLMAFGRDESWIEPLIEYAKGYADVVMKNYLLFRDDFENGLLDPLIVLPIAG